MRPTNILGSPLVVADKEEAVDIVESQVVAVADAEEAMRAEVALEQALSCTSSSRSNSSSSSNAVAAASCSSCRS